MPLITVALGLCRLSTAHLKHLVLLLLGGIGSNQRQILHHGNSYLHGRFRANAN